MQKAKKGFVKKERKKERKKEGLEKQMGMQKRTKLSCKEGETD